MMNKRTNKNDFKARTGHKIVWVVLGLIFFILFLQGAGAFEFDNVKEIRGFGKAGYRDIDIKNSWGFGKVLWSGSLESNTDKCGQDCKATQSITLYETGSLIDEVMFKTLQEDGSWVKQRIRSYQFYIKNGTDWIDYNLGDILPVGTYEIKLEGKKKPTRTVDWVIKSQGVWIDDWAIWGGEYGWTVYDNFNDNSINISRWTTGASCSWTNCYATINEVNQRIEMRANSNDRTGVYSVQLKSVANNWTAIKFNVTKASRPSGDWASPLIKIGNTQIGTIDEGDTGEYIINGTGGNVLVYYNGILKHSNPGVYLNDTVLIHLSYSGSAGGFARRVDLNIDDYEGIFANVILNSPADNFISTTPSVNFNATATVIGGAFINNMSLWHNGTGTWSRNQTLAISTLYENSSNTLVGGNTQNLNKGIRFKTLRAGRLSFAQINLDISPPDRCLLYESIGCSNLISTQTISGGNCNFDYELKNDTDYTLVIDKSGSSFKQTNDLSPSFNNGANGMVDFITGINNCADDGGGWFFVDSLVFRDNSSTQIFTSTISGDTLWGVEACDSDGDCGFSSENRTVFLDDILPVVTISSPSGDEGSYSSGRNLSLEWIATDLGLDTCWYDYNGINTTVGCGTSPQNLTVTDPDNLSLIFYANDTAGNVASNTTSWTYSFVEQNVSFSENASETDSETFQINLTTSLSVLSINARLNYAGVDYTSTSSCLGQNCTITNTIDLPLVSTGESVVNDFFWNFTIFDGSSETKVLTSTRTQNVSRIHLEQCDATYTVQTLNFTAFDEGDNTRIDPFYYAGDFDYWLGSGTVSRSNTFSDTSISEMKLCISPSERDFNVDATIEYNQEINSSTYNTRNYFYQKDVINNQSQDIRLHLLKSADSTSFILKVQDTNLLPIVDALIITERFDPATGNFTIVQIAKTDDNGQTVGFFKTETVDYRFRIKKNGVTLLITGTQKVVPETSPFTLTFTIGLDGGAPWELFEDIDQLTKTLTYDATTGNVTFVYVDSSNIFTLGRLTLKEYSLSSSGSNICDVNSSSSSASLVCGTGSVAGTYIASAYITRGTDVFLVQKIIFKVETFSSIVGLLGVFLAWFIILISAFAFKFNEIAGIILINMTVILINIMGFINFGMTFIFGMMGVSILIIVLLKK